MSKRRYRLTAFLGALVTAVALATPTYAAQSPAATTGSTTFDPLPNLPVNACNNTSLPQDFGTNFPVPSDPNGFGFANETALGWEGNFYAPITYLSGSYFARGVPDTFKQGRTSYCGAMYSFSVYDYGLAAGQAPAPGSVQWTMADGHLPALTTTFTRNDVKISITDFADKQTIAGNPVELMYTRVSVTNEGSADADVPAGQSGPNLVALNSPSETVAPGQTVRHDFAAAVDTFGSGVALPDPATLATAAASYHSAFRHMKSFWNQRLSAIPTFRCRTSRCRRATGSLTPARRSTTPTRRRLSTPGSCKSTSRHFPARTTTTGCSTTTCRASWTTASNSATSRTRRTCCCRGALGNPNFNEEGANWYWDGVWRTPVAWAITSRGTNDVAFVKQYFHDDANGPSQWGPSMYTMMHTDFLSQLNATTGYLKASFDNDSGGTWLFDDETALAGLAPTRTSRPGSAKRRSDVGPGRLHQPAERDQRGLAANEQANDFDILPCEVNVPVAADRCVQRERRQLGSHALSGENPGPSCCRAAS